MQDINNVNREASVGPVNERENVSELEPVVLAEVTVVTGAAPGGTDDSENIVWGTI